jgi:hypothetical protein
MENCLFCKIAAGIIPSSKVYEDEKVLAFNDIDPQAPTHFLVIPKEHITGAGEINEENSGIVAYIFEVIAKIAKEKPHLLVTGGTDFHHDGHEGLCATCTTTKITDSFAVAELIKSRDFVLDLSGSVIIPNFF